MTDKLAPAVAQAREFTEVYRQYKNGSVAIREAMCVKAQFPALMGPIEPDDRFAGGQAAERIAYIGTIWFTMQPSGEGPGKQGGYCFDFAALERYADSPADYAVLEELTSFWRKECTQSKADALADSEIRTFAFPDGQIMGGACGFAIASDLDRLIQRGIPGLLEDINCRMQEAEAEDDDTDFLRALRMVVETMIDVCRHYEAQAMMLANDASGEDRQRLETIAAGLRGIVAHPPHNLQEGIQLLWLYCLMSGGKHPEIWRPDVALGDLFAQDVDSGRLTEEEAVELVLGLWRQIRKHGDPAVSRLLVGGKGRRNEANADRFAMAAMEATRLHREVIPQLTLRFYEGQDPALFEKAFDVLGEGCVFPMLYNDDVIVPGIQAAFGVAFEDACNYHPLGCGEYMLAGISASQLISAWNVPRSLEAALNDGRCFDGAPLGPKTGATASLSSFDALYHAFNRQVEFGTSVLARIHALNAGLYPSECSFLLASLLTDDCIARNRALFEGGVRYSGGCVMGHGFTNTADSLVAIRELVYDRKELTLCELVDALKDDFAGLEKLRRKLLACPKFGNDIDGVDLLLADLWRRMSEAARREGQAQALDFFTISSVNPGGYDMGRRTTATADGRRCGMPFAIGHTPTAGRDTKGITAFLKSIAKIDPANGGATTNVKLSRKYFNNVRDKLIAMFRTYFRMGGMQATVTVVNQEDLLAAIAKPGEHSNLLVRVGGWAARFVDLDREVQQDIIERTAY